MSRLHLNVKSLDWWQSECTESTDSMLKKTWWVWRKVKYTVHNRLGHIPIHGVFVALEACLGRNDISILSRSLPKLASYKYKDLTLDWIADYSCARTSIIGQEIPGSESCSFGMNTCAVSQYPTHWDADLEEFPNFNVVPENAATLLRMSEPMFHILSDVLNIT